MEFVIGDYNELEMFKSDQRMNEISPGNFSCDICNLLIDIRHDDNPD
jgi:hypothetical protein